MVCLANITPASEIVQQPFLIWQAPCCLLASSPQGDDLIVNRDDQRWRSATPGTPHGAAT